MRLKLLYLLLVLVLTTAEAIPEAQVRQSSVIDTKPTEPTKGKSPDDLAVVKAGQAVAKPTSISTTSDEADTSLGSKTTSTSPPSPKEKPSAKVPVVWVLMLTICMSLASGLGALPYYCFGSLTTYWSGIANSVASGVMLSASYGLIYEGQPYSGRMVILGIVLGAFFIKFMQQWLGEHEDIVFEDLKGSQARKVILFLVVMAAHALGEGLGVGVSFSGRRGWSQGVLVTLAIGLHNVPEGLAVATVMAAKGTPPRKTLFWVLLTSCPQALVAVPAYMFVELFHDLLPLAMGLAAGCMIWIVFAELLPEALEQVPHSSHVATSATLAAAGLQALSIMFEQLEQDDGTFTNPFRGPLVRDSSLLILVTLVAFPGVRLLGSLVPSKPSSMGLSIGVQAAMATFSLVHLMLMKVPQPSPLMPLPVGLLLGVILPLVAWRLCMKRRKKGTKMEPHASPVPTAPAAASTIYSQRSWAVPESEGPTWELLEDVVTHVEGHYQEPIHRGHKGSGSPHRMNTQAHRINATPPRSQPSSPSQVANGGYPLGGGGLPPYSAAGNIGPPAVSGSPPGGFNSPKTAAGVPKNRPPGVTFIDPPSSPLSNVLDHSQLPTWINVDAAAQRSAFHLIFLFLYALVEDLCVAQNLVDRPQHVHLILTTYGMFTALLGVAYFGSVRCILAVGSGQVALLCTGLCSLGTVAAVLAAVSSSIAQAAAGPGGMAMGAPLPMMQVLRGVTLGALLSASILVLLPGIRLVNPKRVMHGFAVGAVVGAGVGAASLLIFWG